MARPAAITRPSGMAKTARAKLSSKIGVITVPPDPNAGSGVPSGSQRPTANWPGPDEPARDDLAVGGQRDVGGVPGDARADPGRHPPRSAAERRVGSARAREARQREGVVACGRNHRAAHEHAPIRERRDPLAARIAAGERHLGETVAARRTEGRVRLAVGGELLDGERPVAGSVEGRPGQQERPVGGARHTQRLRLRLAQEHAAVAERGVRAADLVESDRGHARRGAGLSHDHEAAVRRRHGVTGCRAGLVHVDDDDPTVTETRVQFAVRRETDDHELPPGGEDDGADEHQLAIALQDRPVGEHRLRRRSEQRRGETVAPVRPVEIARRAGGRPGERERRAEGDDYAEETTRNGPDEHSHPAA